MTRTGWSYPFFGTLLGSLGVALTGTDAGSNALFGNLQRVTAEQLHVSPVLMAAANSARGVMGKMMDAQSIVVSSVATQQEGDEAAIFKVVFPHSIALASLVACLCSCTHTVGRHPSAHDRRKADVDLSRYVFTSRRAGTIFYRRGA